MPRTWKSPVRYYLMMVLLSASSTATAQIYQWVDDQGQTHYGDSSADPPDAAEQKVIGTVNSTVATPVPAPEQPGEHHQAPARSTITADSWAQQNCTVHVRTLYTERPFIPCVPTDEVQVYICRTEVPRKFSRQLGRRYRYEDRESECGPDVYEGEILYLKP